MANRLILAAASAIALLTTASAEGLFAGDGKVFSGIAANDGEGLFVPRTLFAGRVQGFDTVFDAGLGTDFALVANSAGGELGSGLSPFPAATADDYAFDAKLTAGPVLGGITPYVGVGVVSTPGGSVFQGIPHFLPYEGESFSIQGVAGIAYELMPGVGAGIEYSYRGYVPNAPVPGHQGDNQTIMMRLDLGLN